MRRTNNPNINTKLYWNHCYADKDKRREYAAQGVIKYATQVGNMIIQPTNRFETALKYVKDGDKVLDIGCGVGAFTKLVKRIHPQCEIWGTDISDQTIRDNKVEEPNIKYLHQYVGRQKDVPDNYFDVVFSGEVLEHLDNPIDLFKDAFRVLKHGGTFVMTTPLEAGVISDEHIWFFSFDDITSFYIQSGFEAPAFVDLPYPEAGLVIFAVGKKV